jgi:SAM-dependent methyltransferase
MDPKAMEPQGLALRAYYEGDLDAELTIHRDDGVDDAMRVSHFFRDPSEFTGIETGAINLCSGHVLDAGAGTGIHSQVLQQKGVAVTAIDISPQAVAIMVRQGVKDVHCVDIFRFDDGPFATVLMMGHGIGMVETIGGLSRFLSHARGLVSKNGQVLLDSLDVRLTDDPGHLSYHEANRRAGRYIGEIRLQLSFLGKTGPPCGWLHVDPQTLREQAESTGWRSELIRQEESGHYLARLRRR